MLSASIETTLEPWVFFPVGHQGVDWPTEILTHNSDGGIA